MARLISSTNPLSIHKFNSQFQPSQSPYPVKSFLQTRTRASKFRGIRCQTNPESSETTEIPSTEKLVSDGSSAGDVSSQTKKPAMSSSSADPQFPEFPDKNINRRVAVGSVVAALGLFLSKRFDVGISLKDLSASASPYEQALSNGKPTVVEFYADWCEVCRELAPDVYRVEQQFKDQVNFVMLNVDNTKWEQELDEFGVEGIPHFAFLDREGNEEGNVVGRLPKQYLFENVEALARGEASVPHSRVVGQYTNAEDRKVHPVVDPRSHG